MSRRHAGLAAAALALAIPAAAATEVEDLQRWYAAAATPGHGQADALAEADADRERRWRSDATVFCGLAGSEGFAEAATAGELRPHAVTLPDGGLLPASSGMLTIGGGWRAWSDGLAVGLAGKAIASGPGAPGAARFADAEGDAFVRLPLGAHDALVAWARYDSRRWWWRHAVLPGIAWLHEDGDRLWLMLGLPVAALAWRITPDLELTAAVGDPFHAGIAERFAPAWNGSIDWDWRQDAFRRDGDRASGLALSQDMRVGATLAWTPSAWCEIDASAGWAWHRRLALVDPADARATEVARAAPATLAGLAAYLAF